MNAPQSETVASNARSFRIEPARRDHLTQLHTLIRGLAEYERLTEICVSTERDLADALFGSRPCAEALIATLEDNSAMAVGFGLFFHTYSTFLGRRSLWLEDLFVLPEHRGRGIGRALLRALASLAVERNCGRFEWSVLEWNAPAIAFYETIGATVMPDWRIARVTGESLLRLATRVDAPDSHRNGGDRARSED